ADNQAFVDYGYDGIWIAQHDPNLGGHSPDDTFENINISYQMKTTKIMLAVLIELAIKPIHIQVIIKSPLEGKGYINNKPVIELGFPDNFFQRLRGITIVFGRPIANVEIICNNKIIITPDLNPGKKELTPNYVNRLIGLNLVQSYKSGRTKILDLTNEGKNIIRNRKE
ncbi:MAG: hypothetical protein LN408_04145, partial [Candidatus Thermoplasmatota archaeon]|nr:hypothetical protein [Candidatus Thermoplasmatota archaeon]